MAPVRPASKAKRASSSASIKAHTTYPAKTTDSAFTSSKKDKRLIKQSIFLSKITDSGVKKNKRRRPAKKLVATMESLEDALNEVEHNQMPIEHLKTIKGGRGAAKRREKIVKEERERFGKNLAILCQSEQPKNTGTEASTSRWALLRSHIQANTPNQTEEG